MNRRLLAAAILALMSPAAAQSPQPDAGFETRAIKALSAEQIADLRAGRGMGLALAAELNGYPGPRHTLDLADQIGLSDDQRARVQNLFDEMTAEAAPLGERLVAQEAALDRLFAERTADLDTLAIATAAIGETQGELRRVHLKYHVLTRPLLTQRQMQRYSELRGYAGGGPQQHQHHHMQRH
jgi:Spy/CpxP family protein refolding chaperone